jgi:hypothetical protein
LPRSFLPGVSELMQGFGLKGMVMQTLRAGCWLGLIVVIGLLIWPLIDPALELLGDLFLLGIAIIGLIVSTIADLPRTILLLAAAVLVAILWRTRERQ